VLEQQASEAAPDWAQRRLAGPVVMAEPQEVPAVSEWARRRLVAQAEVAEPQVVPDSAPWRRAVPWPRAVRERPLAVPAVSQGARALVRATHRPLKPQPRALHSEDSHSRQGLSALRHSPPPETTHLRRMYSRESHQPPFQNSGTSVRTPVTVTSGTHGAFALWG